MPSAGEDPDMTRDQKVVAIGAGSGIATMLGSMALLTMLLPVPDAAFTPAGRLAYALRWDALAAVPFFAMIVAVGNARFLGEAIDPTRGAENAAIVVDGRVADNSAQQLLLFLIGSLALVVGLPAERVQMVGAAAIVFFAARILFWIGYRIHPLYRAFGFAATAYLNLGLIGAALWFAAT